MVDSNSEVYPYLERATLRYVEIDNFLCMSMNMTLVLQPPI